MIEPKYIIGDATKPEGDSNRIICHCCNSVGLWGAGFVIALSNKWPITRSEYIRWHKNKNGFELGSVQFVKVESDIVVANMIGQNGIKTTNGIPPIRYPAISECLEKVASAALKNNASVHFPYLMGSDLAGGKWEKIEAIIKETICSKEIVVIIYDINNLRNN